MVIFLIVGLTLCALVFYTILRLDAKWYPTPVQSQGFECKCGDKHL